MPKRRSEIDSIELLCTESGSDMGRRCATLWYYVLLLAYRDAINGYGKHAYQRKASREQARRWLLSDSERMYSARWVSEMTQSTALLDGLARALTHPKEAQSRRVRREVLKLCKGN